ncbi:hypothetical protein FA95DRAFT_1577264 [Auriscalpium vulgare]|uniref:Uncharacterized protein n=1 Tax=Auriscalpium vulgare TaxID=40419 RepID=A0ACB8R7G6_9AGAM|nr:hypothetical protein FA95DRAFT_1577264 [Auriscalpium vulgare]
MKGYPTKNIETIKEQYAIRQLREVERLHARLYETAKMLEKEEGAASNKYVLKMLFKEMKNFSREYFNSMEVGGVKMPIGPWCRDTYKLRNACDGKRVINAFCQFFSEHGQNEIVDLGANQWWLNISCDYKDTHEAEEVVDDGVDDDEDTDDEEDSDTSSDEDVNENKEEDKATDTNKLSPLMMSVKQFYDIKGTPTEFEELLKRAQKRTPTGIVERPNRQQNDRKQTKTIVPDKRKQRPQARKVKGDMILTNDLKDEICFMQGDFIIGKTAFNWRANGINKYTKELTARLENLLALHNRRRAFHEATLNRISLLEEHIATLQSRLDANTFIEHNNSLNKRRRVDPHVEPSHETDNATAITNHK